MDSTSYDTIEAEDILAQAAHQLSPEAPAATYKAGVSVLAAILRMANKLDDTIADLTSGNEGGNAIWLQLRGKRIYVVCSKETGVIEVVNMASGEREVISGVRYNPITSMLEGAVHDARLVPVPGQPIPQRSAVAVVMDAVRKLLTKP